MKLLFIGANNPEVLSMLEALGPTGMFEFCGFIDNDPEKKGRTYCGLPIHGGFECLDGLDPKEYSFVNLITRDAETRFETSKFVAEKGFSFCNFVHPSVDLAGVDLGSGNYIQRNVTLQIGVKLGDNVCINSGTVVSHETTVGSSSFIAPGVTIAGLVEIGDGVLVGAGATVLPRTKLGKWSVIGAGSVVVKDVAPHLVVAGVPARTVRRKPQTYNDGKPW